MSYTQIENFIDEAQGDEVLRETILEAMENSSENRFADKEVRFGRRLG